MKLGIDASNIRAGGGITHLSAILAAAQPSEHEVDEVYVWSGDKTLAALPTRSWLRPIRETALEGNLLRRTAWRFTSLPRRLRENEIDVLLVPGGVYNGGFRPVVALSQNLLPFEEGERQRFGRSLMRLRIELVRRAQIRTFRRADGVIFNTNTARRIIERELGATGNARTTIPFGVDESFSLAPRPQKPIDDYSWERPFKWLYVSTINLYKHQWNVVAAVAMLRREGLPLSLELVGSTPYEPAHRRLLSAIDEWDPAGEFVRLIGHVHPTDVAATYRDADAAVFASTCETPSFVILESMAAGLPIACAWRSAMPEVLDDAADYFDPEDPNSIADALRGLVISVDRRQALAASAFHRSQKCTWSRCAHETMRFVSDVARKAT